MLGRVHRASRMRKRNLCGRCLRWEFGACHSLLAVLDLLLLFLQGLFPKTNSLRSDDGFSINHASLLCRIVHRVGGFGLGLLSGLLLLNHL